MAVEIDETELANYQKLSRFLGQALANKETRTAVLRIQKTLDPNTPIPELDAAAPVLTEVEALRKELTAFREDSQKRETERENASRLAGLSENWEKGRRSLRSSGYNEDGIKKIEELMADKGITDHDIAQAYFERLNPPPAPQAPSAAAFNLLNQMNGSPDDSFKELLASRGKDDGVLQRSINKALSDIRSGR